MKKKCVMAGLLSGVIFLGAIGPASVRADSVTATPYIALGADLKSDEKATVLKLLGVSEKELANYKVDTVTNKEEHQYLDSYLSSSVIGSRALSLVKVESNDKGDGIKVTTKNISYCTTGMYQNSLATAGVMDADVVVAGPFEISGTAALVGTIKAYSSMTGKALEPDNVEAATNELVVTSQLGESLQDQEKAEQLIGAVKDAIVAEEITDPDKIDATIDETAEKLDIEVSEADKAEIRALMEKISDLDLDVDALKEQAQELYDKLGDLDLNISEEQVDGFFASLGSWFSDTWQSIKGWFADLF